MPSDKKFFSDITPEGVIHYPHLDQPDNQGKLADGKYKVTLVIPRDGTDFSKLMALVVATAKQEWGESVDMTTIRKPFINGDHELDKATGQTKPEYAGKILLRLKTQNKPLVVGRDRKAIPPTDEPVHAGDYAIANVTGSAYELSGYPGVTLYLSGLMITRRGERIGGVSAAKLFAGVEAPANIVSRTVVHAAKQTVETAPSDLSLF